MGRRGCWFAARKPELILAAVVAASRREGVKALDVRLVRKAEWAVDDSSRLYTDFLQIVVRIW